MTCDNFARLKDWGSNRVRISTVCTVDATETEVYGPATWDANALAPNFAGSATPPQTGTTLYQQAKTGAGILTPTVSRVSFINEPIEDVHGSVAILMVSQLALAPNVYPLQSLILAGDRAGLTGDFTTNQPNYPGFIVAGEWNDWSIWDASEYVAQDVFLELYAGYSYELSSGSRYGAVKDGSLLYATYDASNSGFCFVLVDVGTKTVSMAGPSGIVDSRIYTDMPSQLYVGVRSYGYDTDQSSNPAPSCTLNISNES
jgi:hypothetical protein